MVAGANSQLWQFNQCLRPLQKKSLQLLGVMDGMKFQLKPLAIVAKETECFCRTKSELAGLPFWLKSPADSTPCFLLPHPPTLVEHADIHVKPGGCRGEQPTLAIQSMPPTTPKEIAAVAGWDGWNEISIKATSDCQLVQHRGIAGCLRLQT